MLPKLSILTPCRNVFSRQTRTFLTKNTPLFRTDYGSASLYEPTISIALNRTSNYHCRPSNAAASTSLLLRPSSRSFLVSSPPPEGAPADEDVQWTNVYRFDFITAFRGVSRFKILQSGLTLYLIPVMGYMCFVTESQPVSTFYTVIGMTTFAALMLFVFTRITQVRVVHI